MTIKFMMITLIVKMKEANSTDDVFNEFMAIQTKPYDDLTSIMRITNCR